MPFKENKILQIYFNDVPDEEFLTREEEKELGLRIQQGDQEAKHKLINRNLRLPISVAKNYRDYGLDFPDLIQAGNIGLMKAVDKYDPGKKNKFATYATWWVRQSILKELSQNSKTIRLPYHINRAIRDVGKAEKKYKSEYGKEPSLEELVEMTDYSKEKLEKALRAKRMNGVSLNGEIKRNIDREGREIIDILEGKGYTPEESYLEEEYDILDTIYECEEEGVIKDRQKRILLLRYGLEMRNPLTLKECGEVFDLSEERIRQLQNKALKDINSYLTENDSKAEEKYRGGIKSK